MDKWENRIENDLDQVKVRTYGNTSTIRQHAEQLEGIDNKTRSNNLIVEGLAEFPQDTDLRNEVCAVINKSLPHFVKDRIKVADRLGKERKSKIKPRPILVTTDGQHTREYAEFQKISHCGLTGTKTRTRSANMP